MDTRENDPLVELDQHYEAPKNDNDINQMMDQLQEKAAEKFDDINQTVKYEMRALQEKLGFKGDRTQVYQQTALIVTVIQIIISTYLSMLISQTAFLGKAWTFVPWLQYIFVIIYIVSLICIQYLPDTVYQARYNFAFGCAHSISKIIIIVYLTIWFFDIRVEVFLVAVISLLGYITFKIYIPTQRQEEFELKVKDIWKKMTLFQFCVSFFLMYFTRSEFLVGLLVFFVTLAIGIYTILSLQRFKEHTYLSFHSNDIYLGALQLEADMLLPCGLITFLMKNKSRSNSLSDKLEEKNVDEIEKAQSEQKVRVQSATSLAEV